jgi:hypothetical protein
MTASRWGVKLPNAPALTKRLLILLALAGCKPITVAPDEWVGVGGATVTCPDTAPHQFDDAPRTCIGGDRVLVCIRTLATDRSHWRWQCAPMPAPIAPVVPAERGDR